MFIKILLSYIAGYMRINVEGYFVERFVNMCTKQKILLWNTKRNRSTNLISNISIQDFRALRKIAKATKCKVTIKNKKGLPFLFERYKKRKILAILLVIFFIGMVAISNFIWNIEIECKDEINKQEITDILENNGLQIGKLKTKLDTSKIVRALRYEREDIAWAGISFKGTNAIVEIVKAQEKPDIINEEEYCSILSNKEGVITKINVQNGTAAVKVGDLVKKDTILVNGWLEGKYTGIRYVHSVADIEAKVWYSKKEKIYKEQELKVKTGKEEKKYSLKLNNFKINLFKTLSKFENYDTIVENKKLKLFSHFYLPVELIIMQNFETETQNVTYTADEIKEKYIPKLEQEIEKDIENKENVVNKQINFEECDTYVEIEVIYEVIENIGTKEKIVF